MSQPLLNLSFLSSQNRGNSSGLDNFKGLVNATKKHGGVDINKNGDVAGEKKTPKVSTDKAVKNSIKEEKDLSKQIRADINPVPMLSTAMLFKWDYKAGGTVVDLVDFKTGKIIAQVPPEQILKMMPGYQKGMFFNNKL